MGSAGAGGCGRAHQAWTTVLHPGRPGIITMPARKARVPQRQISSVDTFLVKYIGAGTDNGQMLVVVSEAAAYAARVYPGGSVPTGLIKA